jgi:hypothetical protein
MDKVLAILISITILLVIGVAIGMLETHRDVASTAGNLANTIYSSGTNILFGTGHENENIPPYPGGKYFTMDNGTSKIYLINSTANYGTYSQDMSLEPGGNPEARAGDRCVIINGALRNDYNRSYWIDLSAQLYDANGKPVGKVLTDVPTHYAGQVYAESNSTVNFSFTVQYDKKDVSRYELSGWLAPAALP